MRYHPAGIFPPGTIVCNSYEIVRFLGIGGSGVVYHCRHRDLSNYPLALKVLAVESEAEVERFKRELIAGYQVSHPNVIRTYELIVTDSILAFTMEFAGGGSLADRISATGALPFPQIVDTLIAIAQGLEAIHAAGIVHRDLKPENILHSTEGNIKIADFGIARLDRPIGNTPKNLLGTLEYVSPEYVQHGTVDARSDLYSLGVMAYEMITGRVPFRSEAPLRTLCMRLEENPIPVEELRCDCPAYLAQILGRLLERHPALRYQSASELLRDLEKLKKVFVQDNVLQPQEPKAQRAQRKRAERPAWKAPQEGRLPTFARRRRYRNRKAEMFAATTFVLWILTLALWVYTGKYQQYFGIDRERRVELGHESYRNVRFDLSPRS